MIDAVPIRRSERGSVLALGVDRASVVDGERLAVVATAAAVALLPLLVPRGPANISPVDAPIAVAMLACLVWAGASGHRWRFPYAIPMGLLIIGGALGALAGPVPVPGIVALLQDLVLLAWCWAVVNLASSPERLRILLATWAYSSIAWAVLLFVGLAIGSATIAGQTAEEGSRTALTFADPSVSANYYFISIMIMWAAGFPRTIGLRLAASVLLFAALVSTGSNSAIVSVIVGAAVALLVGIYRRAGIAPAISALAFLVIGGYLAASTTNAMGIQEAAHESRYAFLRDGIGRGQTSVTQRDTLLRESLRLYETGGPLGGGPVSTKPRLENEGAPFVKEAHNDYLAALIERGAVGLLGFLILVAGLVVRTLAFAGGRLTGGFRAVVVRPSALVGAVAGTMVAEAVYELLHVRHVWTLFAFVAALYVWGRDWRGSATS